MRLAVGKKKGRNDQCHRESEREREGRREEIERFLSSKNVKKILSDIDSCYALFSFFSFSAYLKTYLYKRKKNNIVILIQMFH